METTRKGVLSLSLNDTSSVELEMQVSGGGNLACQEKSDHEEINNDGETVTSNAEVEMQVNVEEKFQCKENNDAKIESIRRRTRSK
ncbi:hypothetical protein Pint_13802 [Pistacia integerrima]|uniref:Uncharacterized protein n=1 Tax=Pistacia integerrima TaxID=434235 RepID=A0ACC0Y3Q3_9ROSI|nr:hypothetical protein Pint_13802 [Pistacia integerrima]